MQLVKLILTSLLFVAPVAATDAKGTLWLKEKSQEKDVVATGSGLLYKVGFLFVVDYLQIMGNNRMRIRRTIKTRLIHRACTMLWLTRYFRWSQMSLFFGFRWQVLNNAESPAKSPLVSSPTVCHYRGTLINGKEFDSSYKRGSPATFAPNQVIKGWTEAMQLMKEGDKW